jgi:transcriptional regulator with XRE-family HTH domain
MRRMMLGMTQVKLGGAVGLTFQQVQKYEMGATRLSASRLQQIANILKVPPAFFFEGLPQPQQGETTEAPIPTYVFEFLATFDGLNLTKAFMKIERAKLRRSIVDLVEELAGK